MKNRFGYDDSLDAFGVHGIGGALGTIATGLFAQKILNPGGADGLLFGSSKMLISQIIAVSVTAIYSFVVTVIILKVIDWTIGLRVDEEAEVEGLDISQHGESGYTL